MKAFKKWWNKDCTDGINWNDDKVAKLVWRAALEWAKEQQVSEYEDFVLISTIDKELKDK